MDIVFIRGLKIQTTIGFFEWEQQIKQTLVIDAELGWDIGPAAEQDDLAQTLDYAEISEQLAEFANSNPVALIETLAQRMAKFLMARYDIPWLRLSIAKPTAVHNADAVGVVIERGQRH
jgi:7,8-dihydroneopterin aldolase/epimerase/oxygenase